MARLWQSGFELNSATAGVEWDFVSSIAIDTATVRSGTYSGKANFSGSTASYFQFQFASSSGNGPYFLRTYFLVSVLPSAETDILWLQQTSGSFFHCAAIYMSTTGALRLYNFDGSGVKSQVGNDSLPLSLNLWYCIELKFDRSPANGSQILEARINGSTFAQSSTLTISNAPGTLAVGANGAGQTSTGTYYYDDVAFNDSTNSFQNSWCGEGKIIHLIPSATGDSNGFLTQVGGTAGAANNYTRVDELPPNDATDYNGSAVLSAEDLFNCTNSGISMSDTINVVAVGARMADLVSADSLAAFKFELESVASGTKSQSADIIPNSTSWLTNTAAVPHNYPLVTYQTPEGVPWSQVTLDSMQIGYLQDVTNVQTIAVSTVWASIDYRPAIANRFSSLQRQVKVGNGMSRSESAT